MIWMFEVISSKTVGKGFDELHSKDWCDSVHSPCEHLHWNELESSGLSSSGLLSCACLPFPDPNSHKHKTHKQDNIHTPFCFVGKQNAHRRWNIRQSLILHHFPRN